MGLRQTTLLIASAALALSGTVRPDDGPAGAGARPEDWIQLFNGKDKKSRRYRPYFEKDDPAACLGE
jgi:hypothetical protein